VPSTDFDGDPVVRAAEDESAYPKGDYRRHRGVRGVGKGRRVAEEQRCSKRLDRRRHEVQPVDEEFELWMRVGARELVEPVEDGRQEEPGEEQSRD
jgi:hypothetical protein